MGFKQPRKKSGQTKEGAIQWALDTTVKNIANNYEKWAGALIWLEKAYELDSSDKRKIRKNLEARIPDSYHKKVVQHQVMRKSYYYKK